MKSIPFKDATIAIGAKQPDEYNTLYAATVPTGWKEGEIVMCFKLEPEEIEEIKRTGKIYYTRLTFGSRCNNPKCKQLIPFMPMRISVVPTEGVNFEKAEW